MHSYKKKSKKEDTGLHPEKIEYIPGKIKYLFANKVSWKNLAIGRSE
jgi:hypothetical protein